MKKLYTSPELELISLVSSERIATVADFDNQNTTNVGGSYTQGDTEIDIPL